MEDSSRQHSLEEPYDEETVRFAKDCEDDLLDLGVRLHSEGTASHGHHDAAGPAGRTRNQLWRDYARILYSSSFRRLQGKMQLLGIEQTGFFRNRLTHSLEVSQIARGIASKLQLREPVVAEACSLVHDLGNPPFGHAGEHVLGQEVGANAGGYEGNAQTLRILMHLEKKILGHGGLNLTLRTLLGTIKYDYCGHECGQEAQGSRHPKYIYQEDYNEIHQQLKELGKDNLADSAPIRTIDMQIMDLADEIAYAAHDLEDCLAAGHFSIDELIHEFRISGRNASEPSEDFSGAADKLDEVVRGCREFAQGAHRLNSSEEYAFLFRKELTSSLVNRLVNDLGVIRQDDGREKLDYKEDGLLAHGLKMLIFKATQRRPDVHLYEKQGEKIIRGLFRVYTDDNYNDKRRLLPPEYRELDKGLDEEKTNRRLAADYIGGMQDSFAVQEYERHFGKSALESPFADLEKRWDSEVSRHLGSSND